jgi:hypothetical protein
VTSTLDGNHLRSWEEARVVRKMGERYDSIIATVAQHARHSTWERRQEPRLNNEVFHLPVA